MTSSKNAFNSSTDIPKFVNWVVPMITGVSKSVPVLAASITYVNSELLSGLDQDKNKALLDRFVSSKTITVPSPGVSIARVSSFGNISKFSFSSQEVKPIVKSRRTKILSIYFIIFILYD